MDFAAIDFETANSDTASACALGVAVVRGGEIVQIKEWYIKPQPLYFSAFNTAVHGMTAADVADCPTFFELWPEIEPYLAGQFVAAHNAPFDLAVLRALACKWGLENHRLDTVCGHLGIGLNHHNAASDAEGCARIVLQAVRLAAQSGKKPETVIRTSRVSFT
ncbi:MAG: DNA polymerase III PolC-type [Firmicutes bacterium ADurb.Bin262]|nr:MAG: DNA polymerase III PolC-type [Firmicutes bacterium ADurb.Bin262]